MKIQNLPFLILSIALIACSTTNKGKDMSQDTPIHHSINYIEFAVTDMDTTKKFYGEAFDWKFTDYAPSYVGIQKEGGGEVGGFRLEKSIQAGGPLVVLYSNNLEESFKKVSDSGGKITKEIFEFPGGRRFEFKDPSGNDLAVWAK